MYIKVNRRNRQDCIVLLCQDRARDKWCYVNLSTEHVCACRFDTIDDDIADMKNTGSRWGGASTAGVFLQKFVKNVKWAHIDIAGVAFLEKPQKEFIAGATGAGVRTLLNYILEQ